MTMIAIDPGETTGWSEWTVPQYTSLRTLDRHMERRGYGVVHGGFEGVLRALVHDSAFYEALRRADLIVIEQYVLQARTMAGDLETRDTVGAMCLYGAQHGIEVVRQPPSAKRGVPDAVLKENGLYLGKADVDHVDARDVNDSQVHALAWGRIHHPPTLAHYWPPPEQVHNHGPAEGRGLDCPERTVDGRLRGACLDPGLGSSEGSDR